MNKPVDKLLRNDWDEFTDKLGKLQTCNHTLDGSKAILEQLGYRNTEVGEICRWFELNGGYCDCEVILNVVMREHLRGLEQGKG
jgi:hypothetical protein